MDFSDNKHNLAELAFQGATKVAPEQICTRDAIQAVATWSHRPKHRLSATDLLRLSDCPLFSINYEGKIRGYWKNESENDISETLKREFLYQEGLCSLSDERI